MRILETFDGSAKALLAALISTSFASAATAMTVTKTVDPPDLVSIDGCGSYCNTLPSLSFDATDFPPSAVVTDVDASITWFKTDGSCTMPGSGGPFHAEVSFRLDGPAATNVILAPSGTWGGPVVITSVTTVFDQAAAAVPSGVPVSGSFLPTPGNLNDFNGLSALSTWTLRAGDNGAGDPLCVDRYSVTVTAESPVLINEVDADTAGTDTLEFVELYDGGIGNTPLDGLVVVFYNGAGDTAYAAFDLDGQVTDADGYFVLGNAAVANVSLVFADNFLQNGADAVALYMGDATDFPNGTAVTATNLVDALVYDTNDGDDAGLLALLLPAQAQINEDGNANKDFESNQRCPDGAGGARVTSGYTQDFPTPGSENCVAPTADLSITKTDGVTSAAPGASVTYTITGSNAGPAPVVGASVVDNFPATLSCNWTCVGAGGGSCTAAGMGNINDSVDLPAGASVTYTANCAIASSATGSLSNTASISSAITDPNMANNSAIDIDTLVPDHDLAISKDDGVASAVPGNSVTYTMVASNAAGPSNAVGAVVSDSFPAFCTTVSWTCVGAGGGACTASGSGNISELVDLPVGGTATFSATCAIDSAATGTLDNTVTMAGAAGSTDPVAANNSATDSDTLVPTADVAITKTDGVTSAVPGQSVTYTVVASNAGPSDAVGATVSDSFPAACTAVSWTCTGAGGGSCAANGSGDIADAVNMPVGATVTYTANCSIDPAATGTLDNSATIAVAAGTSDPNAGNNSATDSDTLDPSADLSITKVEQDVPVPTLLGSSFSYLLTASNDGPSAATGVVVSDSLPGTLSYVSDNCGATFAAPTLTWNIDTLASGSNASCTVNVTVAAPGSIVNTATLSSATADPTSANNAATSTVAGAQEVDVAISLAANAGAGLMVGDSYTYTVTGTNLGVGLAGGLDFTLSLSEAVSFDSSSCGAVLAGNTLSWSVATLADGDSTSCDIAVVMVLPGIIQATASVVTATSDPNLANNSADLTVSVTAIPIPALDRYGLLLLILLSAGLGMVMLGRARAA